MYYHNRISYLSIQRIRYIPPHDPPSGQHRGKQVQCDANPEGVREDRHIEQHPRREEDIPARPQKIEPRHEEGVTEDEHQHVGEEQPRHAPGQHQHHILHEDLPHQRSLRRPERLADTQLADTLLYSRRVHPGKVQRRYQQEKEERHPKHDVGLGAEQSGKEIVGIAQGLLAYHLPFGQPAIIAPHLPPQFLRESRQVGRVGKQDICLQQADGPVTLAQGMVHGDGEGGISDPRLGVDIGGYAGDVVHNTAHGILQAVQQDRLPRRRLVPKQPAGQRAAQHRTGHAGEELGLGEGPPSTKSKR